MTLAILVADDEAGMRDTLVDILEGAGYTVEAVADGAAALAMARRQPFDVVLMDVRMPAMTGVEVCEELVFPPPQVVLITAYALEDQLRRARDTHVFAIVQKPFSVPYLLEVVANAAKAA
jgi:CheY-like chemotaxis protein